MATPRPAGGGRSRRVLVVDDDVQLTALLSFALRREGYEVIAAHDGLEALSAFDGGVDLVVLDVNLPTLDGYGVLRAVRARGATPVIMLTVRGEEADIVRGLDLGADDYISKPFSPSTLMARIRAVLRRVGTLPAEDLSVGDLVLDLDRHEARVGDGEPIRLTQLEYRLLHVLMLRAGHVVPYEILIESVWGYGPAGDRSSLKRLVRRLRLKIEGDPSHPAYVRTVGGVGYEVCAPP